MIRVTLLFLLFMPPCIIIIRPEFLTDYIGILHNNINLCLLISHLNDFVYDHMMSCLTYTREYEAFTWGLMQTKDFYEEIVFLNKNISFIKTIEDANEILVNNVL